jgi:hypothetical protein
MGEALRFSREAAPSAFVFPLVLVRRLHARERAYGLIEFILRERVCPCASRNLNRQPRRCNRYRRLRIGLRPRATVELPVVAEVRNAAGRRDVLAVLQRVFGDDARRWSRDGAIRLGGDDEREALYGQRGLHPEIAAPRKLTKVFGPAIGRDRPEHVGRVSGRHFDRPRKVAELDFDRGVTAVGLDLSLALETRGERSSVHVDVGGPAVFVTNGKRRTFAGRTALACRRIPCDTQQRQAGQRRRSSRHSSPPTTRSSNRCALSRIERASASVRVGTPKGAACSGGRDVAWLLRRQCVIATGCRGLDQP